MNPDFIALSTELAVFFQETGNPRAALPLYQQSLNLASAIGQHDRILYIQLGLAQVYMALGMMENSLECARNSARGAALLLGAEHPLTLQSIAFFMSVQRHCDDSNGLV
jgi:tetratricopeptide (TPR) repeat protein